MNAIQRAQDAYRQQTQAIRTERGIEYDAFARITHRLKVAGSFGPGGFREMVAALHANRRLWTVLATDVADKNNSLPPDVRARIIYLAEFTRLQSSKVLRGEATVNVLVEINSAIMRGLGGQRNIA
ncbi:MAG: flagellar biosynthesis regulator FlhF [Rhodobacteraceae bacterium CG17_big_fil_post_rev_8_21_14_2_50_63_15]|nr:flagellar biosynthesis regulator FlaF [Roseovarius sp.]PIV77318.1 MAG: flagellar biosynthesis regulator FlhF [Rhodobacteraceae bacterium CG17_big_fil_post_rev_8_21_14_2_50_63_15]